MSVKFASHVSKNAPTPQTSPIAGREEDMVKNNAGGYSFKLDPWKALERFLILGTEGGSYYASEREATIKVSGQILECIEQNPRRVVDLLVNISETGRSNKNDYALFCLALVMAEALTPEDKFYARQALNRVARTGTHILHFAEFIKSQKGWGTGTKKAFQNWYLSKTPEELAFQYMKYKQRDRWSHRDILRLAHPKGSEEHNALFAYITKKGKESQEVNLLNELQLPQQLKVAESLHSMTEKGVISAIKEYSLPREVIPTEMLNSKAIWEALLPSMGITAMIRNLGKMSSIGILTNTSGETKRVVKLLTDHEILKKARVHPIALLFALKTYCTGRGFRGSLSWTPVKEITEALEAAFTASFDFVPSTGKRRLFALDISGSMQMNSIQNSNVSCREASVVLAMIAARKETNYEMIGFGTSVTDLKDRIRAESSFYDNMTRMNGLPFGGTDCSLPMVYASRRNLSFDSFEVYTDNETYAGKSHPSQELQKYRKKMNLPESKLAVVGMVSNNFTIADPKDPNMLDVVGFDTGTPQVLSMFTML